MVRCIKFFNWVYNFCELNLSLAANLTLALLKNKKYEACVAKAQPIKDDNIKVLYRSASAFIQLNRFEQADKDIEAMLAIEPNNKEALNLQL